MKTAKITPAKTGHHHRRKVCPQCGVEKKLDRRTFVVLRRNGKNEWKHCRRCDRKRQAAQRAAVAADPERAARHRAAHREGERRRYAANPEQYREYQRTYRRRLKENDPERYAEYFLIPRRFRTEGRPRLMPALEGYRGNSSRDAVPAEPLRDYIVERFAGWTVGEVHEALRAGASDRLIYRILTGADSDRITIDAADRVLTVALGRPDLLNVLYPCLEAAA